MVAASCVAIVTTLPVCADEYEPTEEDRRFMYELLRVQDDCSQGGFDSFSPAPESEGNGLLSFVNSIQFIDEVPSPSSRLGIADCLARVRVNLAWDDSDRAAQTLGEIRKSEKSFAAMVEVLRENSADARPGRLLILDFPEYESQESCGCRLHYGIEVLQ